MDFYRWIRAQWDRTAAVLAFLLGIIALFLGWLGTSGKTLPTQQIPYLISGGMVGIFALGLAGTLWLSADLRDEWRKLDAIHRAISARPVEQPAAVEPAVVASAKAPRTRRTG